MLLNTLQGTRQPPQWSYDVSCTEVEKSYCKVFGALILWQRSHAEFEMEERFEKDTVTAGVSLSFHELTASTLFWLFPGFLWSTSNTHHHLPVFQNSAQISPPPVLPQKIGADQTFLVLLLQSPSTLIGPDFLSAIHKLLTRWQIPARYWNLSFKPQEKLNPWIISWQLLHPLC